MSINAGADPILKLNARLIAAENQWEPAQRAAEQIEWSVPENLRLRPEGRVKLAAAGYVEARMRESRFSHRMERIERDMAKTVPTTLPGILTLARLAERNELRADGRDRRMLARVIEAMGALPPATTTDIALTLARRVLEEYHEADADSARGRAPLGSGMLPALVLALETIAAPRLMA